MPVKVTKKAIEDIRVQERKKMREKHKHHKFMQRTLQMYNSDKQRAKEAGENMKYTLEEFREKAKSALEIGLCPYSSDKLTVANFAADHATPLSRGGWKTLGNIVFCTRQSNYRKGSLTACEYDALVEFVGKLHPDAQRDIFTRLTCGGKFLPGR